MNIRELQVNTLKLRELNLQEPSGSNNPGSPLVEPEQVPDEKNVGESLLDSMMAGRPTETFIEREKAVESATADHSARSPSEGDAADTVARVEAVVTEIEPERTAEEAVVEIEPERTAEEAGSKEGTEEVLQGDGIMDDKENVDTAVTAEEDTTKVYKAADLSVAHPSIARNVAQLSERVAGRPVTIGVSEVEISDDALEGLAREYSSEVKHCSYVGDSQSMLKWAVGIERAYAVTLPLSAYGLDPVVFHSAVVENEEGAAEYVEVELVDKDGMTNTAIYELLNVQNNLYLSCISESLDPEYLYNIIAEATESLHYRAFYKFDLIGLRTLLNPEGDKHRQLISTLRLNTYEMAVLKKALLRSSGAEGVMEVNEFGEVALVFHIAEEYGDRKLLIGG